MIENLFYFFGVFLIIFQILLLVNLSDVINFIESADKKSSKKEIFSFYQITTVATFWWFFFWIDYLKMVPIFSFFYT
jgi:hypothetical protein